MSRFTPPGLRRPTPQRLETAFRARLGTPPPTSKVYRLDIDQPVTAIPEYADMGAVLIAYLEKQRGHVRAAALAVVVHR